MRARHCLFGLALCLSGCDSAPPPPTDFALAEACKLDNNGAHVRTTGLIELPGSVSCDEKTCEFYLADSDGKTHDLIVNVGDAPNSVLPFGSDIHMSSFKPEDVRFKDAKGTEFGLGEPVSVSATLVVERMKNVATKEMQDYCDFTATKLELK